MVKIGYPNNWIKSVVSQVLKKLIHSDTHIPITRPGKREQKANWKITILSSVKHLFIWSIFHSYVKLPEGKFTDDHIIGAVANPIQIFPSKSKIIEHFLEHQISIQLGNPMGFLYFYGFYGIPYPLVNIQKTMDKSTIFNG
jgi:hypothetical protein